MATGTVVDVVMPQMGVSVSEGTISRWAKQVGEKVEADETIVEISTDKVDTEVPSPATGVVREILVPEGETVPVGTRIAVIDSGDGASAPAPAPAEPPPAAQAGEPSLEPSQDRPHFQEYQLADAPPTQAEKRGEDGAVGQTNGESRGFMSP